MEGFVIEDAEIIKHTGEEGAVLVDAPGFFDKPEWIPYRCVHDDSEIYREGESGTLMVKMSWAEKKGWT